MQSSEVNFQELVFSFSHVGTEDQTQVFGFLGLAASTFTHGTILLAIVMMFKKPFPNLKSQRFTSTFFLCVCSSHVEAFLKIHFELNCLCFVK